MNIVGLTEDEVQSQKYSDWIHWVCGMAFMCWVFHESNQSNGLSTFQSVGITIISIPVGWLLGYKWGVGAFFTSLRIRVSPKASESSDTVQL